MRSIAEYADITLTEVVPVGELLEALNRFSESGLVFSGVRRLADRDAALSKAIQAVDMLALLPVEEDLNRSLQIYRDRYRQVLSQQQIPVEVQRKGKTRTVNLEDVLMDGTVEPSDAFVSSAMVEPGRVVARLRLRVGGASLRPAEVTSTIFDIALSPADFMRIHCWSHHEGWGNDRSPGPGRQPRCARNGAGHAELGGALFWDVSFSFGDGFTEKKGLRFQMLFGGGTCIRGVFV